MRRGEIAALRWEDVDFAGGHLSVRATLRPVHHVVLLLGDRQFDRGGHFAAMEAPDLLVDDVRAFFRKVR
ncbi:hypothetical protein [Pseudonocardia aurantiaca]|uniref:Tyr recombinase domain-containing protein n=1 Tax=Pseudonocardia aurantiaca TaxID=75290 RepID=A0ABW4FIQ0_9PSEU